MLKKNIIEIYREECNCGLQIKHNNGGNYHAVHRLHIISDEDAVYCVILEKTTTREDFPGDRYEILTFQDGEFRLEGQAHEDKIVKIEKWYPVCFRQGEAKILCQKPQAFIKARKRHARRLAAAARAFGHDVSWEDFLLDV